MENKKGIEKVKEIENDLETQEPKIIKMNAEPFDLDQEIDNVNRDLKVVQDKLDDITNIVLEKLEKEESDNLNQSKENEELNNNVKIMGIEIGGFFVSWIISMAIIFLVMSKYPNVSTGIMTIYVMVGTICVSRIIRVIVNEITKRIKNKNNRSNEKNKKSEEKEQMDRMEVLEKITFETKIEECLESVSLLKAILSEKEREKVFIDCNNQKININFFYKSEQLMKRYVNQIIDVKKEEQGIILLKLKEK